MYLDANFFIIAIFDQTKRGEEARKIQGEIMGTEKELITSSLALDEIMWVVVKQKKETELRNVIEEIYSIPNLSIKEVSSIIPLKALEFIEKYRLRPRDAFHVAMMKTFGIKEIVSDDSDFDKVEWIKRIKI